MTVLRRIPRDLLDEVAQERQPERLRRLTLRRLLGVARLDREADRRRRLRALMQ